MGSSKSFSPQTLRFFFSQHLSCHQVLPQYHGAGVVAAAAGRGTSCITSALETSTYMGYMTFIGTVYGTMGYAMVIVHPHFSETIFQHSWWHLIFRCPAFPAFPAASQARCAWGVCQSPNDFGRQSVGISAQMKSDQRGKVPDLRGAGERWGPGGPWGAPWGPELGVRKTKKLGWNLMKLTNIGGFAKLTKWILLKFKQTRNKTVQKSLTRLGVQDATKIKTHHEETAILLGCWQLESCFSVGWVGFGSLKAASNSGSLFL